VSRYQKGKTILDFIETRDSEWQWPQLGHMQVSTSLQTDNASNPPFSFFTGWIPFLPPNQQRQSTEGINIKIIKSNKKFHLTQKLGWCTVQPLMLACHLFHEFCEPNKTVKFKGATLSNSN